MNSKDKFRDLKPKKALFPGTFDPFTIGHESLVKRGLTLFDEVIISVGINDSKRTSFTLEERMEMIRDLYKNNPAVRVESYDTLTVDFAKKLEADFILRGIRSVSDFEYERTIADINRTISGVETVVLFAEPEFAHVNSTHIRELFRYNHDITPFIPKGMKIKKINIK